MNKKVFDKLQYISKNPIINGDIEDNILLNDEAKEILQELQQKENIIKEAREYIESYMPNYDFDKTNLIKLLEILGRENDDK